MSGTSKALRGKGTRLSGAEDKRLLTIEKTQPRVASRSILRDFIQNPNQIVRPKVNFWRAILYAIARKYRPILTFLFFESGANIRSLKNIMTDFLGGRGNAEK